MTPVYDNVYIVNGDMSANVTGAPFSLKFMYGYCAQANWTAGATGTIKLQGSNDSSTWSDITGTSVSITGSSGSQLWNNADIYYQWFRIVYTAVSGSGTLNANVYAKGT